MKTIYIAVIAFGIFLSACADPAANKPKALTAEPVNTAAKAQDPKAVTSKLAITPESSTIAFTGSKVTGKHEGGFKSFSGSIDLVDDKPESSSVNFERDMASVHTDADGLTKHLQTPDFFDVAKFPKSTFVSKKIVADAGKASSYNVTGDLTMRGVTKSITFPATIELTPKEVVVKAEFSINRKDFGIAYAGKADDLIRDDVVIKLDLKAPKK